MQTALSERLPSAHDPISGAWNLLLNCAKASVGERILIAYEPEDFGYFDGQLRHHVQAVAEEIGLKTLMVDVGFDPDPSGIPDRIAKLVPDVDIVLFLARLGDQLRFSELIPGPRYVTCFALNSTLLGSAFGTGDYIAFGEIKTAVDERILSAEEIIVSCSAGTRVTGRVPKHVNVAEDTTSSRFPMSIFSPVLADDFSGRVALGGFLTGTGSRYYDVYSILFDSTVFAMLEAGRLAGFEGAASDVAKANAQYDRVSERFQLDRNAVHSWHAGIHPGCGFPWNLHAHFEQWGGAAFGNPRVLHFHTCGALPPGEISWNVFDPTICVDGTELWNRGHFHLERLPQGPDILARYPSVARLFLNPDRNIGLGDVS